MADGKEEREEQESRTKQGTEQESRKNREDQFDRDYPDQWTPERVDS